MSIVTTFESTLTEDDYLSLHRFEHRSPVLKVLCWIFYLGLPTLLTWAVVQLARGAMFTNVLAISLIPGTILLLLLFAVRASRSKWNRLSPEERELKGWVSEDGIGWLSVKSGCNFKAWSAYSVFKLSESGILLAGSYAAPCVLPRSMFEVGAWRRIVELVKANVTEHSRESVPNAVFEPPQDHSGLPKECTDFIDEESLAIADGMLAGSDFRAASHSLAQLRKARQSESDSSRKSQYTKFAFWLLVIGGTPLIIHTFKGSGDSHLPTESPLFLSCVTVVLFFIVLYLFFSWQMRRSQRGVGFEDSPIKIHFKPSGLLLCCAHDYALRRWNQFATYHATSEAFLLFLKDGHMQVIPSRHFASEADLEKARDVIQENLDDMKTYHERQTLAEMGLSGRRPTSQEMGEEQ